MPSNVQLDKLFPNPSPPPSDISPARWPGISPDTNLAVRKTLRDNHEKWHIFFNERGFHNHAAHHLLAIYALGANGPLIEAAYETHAIYQRPTFASPSLINEINFSEHLGDGNYYNAYLQFFSHIVLDKGAAATLEEYIFSPKMNVAVNNAASAQMLNRFMAGLLHPLIHIGYGLEFGLLGIVAEGLAQTAVHSVEAPVLTPSSLFEYTAAASSDPVSSITALLPSLTLRETQSGNPQAMKKSSMHAFSILSRVLGDSRFAPSTIGLPPPEDAKDRSFERVLRICGEALVQIANEWTVDGTDTTDVAQKIEELVWANTIIYGVGGWSGRANTAHKGKEFNADFFAMHLVTSLLFLPPLVANLSPTSNSILLRTYFVFSLAWWVSRGRPALPIREFYDATSAFPTEPNAHLSPAKNTLTPSTVSPNPWLPLVQTTLVHPNEHLCKLQRALVHFGAIYGTRTREDFGTLAKSGEGLHDVVGLDGTLFIRVAGLTANRLGWMREGQDTSDWDRVGFYN